MSRRTGSWYPPPSKPRAVEGGIKARSSRGEIAQTWWSKRFIEVLSSIVVGSRLARGRSYARKGQVLDLTIDAGAVTGTVQGSRARPYRVRIGLSAFGKTDWQAVGTALAADAWYSARLLAGDMPQDIEDVFSSCGLTLFPASAAELTMDCSCPDWQVPCKHLAAVFYLLAESFDADPFLILAWRGREKDDLLDALAAARAGGTPGDRARRADAGPTAPPLSECLGEFFAPAVTGPPPVPVPTPPDAVLDQLPAIRLTARGREVTELLRPLYLAQAGAGPAGASTP